MYRVWPHTLTNFCGENTSSTLSSQFSCLHRGAVNTSHHVIESFSGTSSSCLTDQRLPDRHLQPPITTNLLSVSMSSAFSASHVTLCGFAVLCLAYFSVMDALQVHPCHEEISCILKAKLYSIVIHMPHFLYPFICWWMLRLIPSLSYYDSAAVHLGVQISWMKI